MTQEKWRCYVAKPYVEVSGKNRGLQNKRCSVRGIGEEQLEFREMTMGTLMWMGIPGGGPIGGGDTKSGELCGPEV